MRAKLFAVAAVLIVYGGTPGTRAKRGWSPPCAAAAPRAPEEQYYEYRPGGTLRLKVYGTRELQARLEVQVHQGSGRPPTWEPVPVNGVRDGWKWFEAPSRQTSPPQYLCDLPLTEARRLVRTVGASRYVRLTVRRPGVWQHLLGSWRGELLLPLSGGLRAWTYWLPSQPPPWQDATGLLGLLVLVSWIGCILAVRAEARAMGLAASNGLWPHAGWLHLPGALLFFMRHPAPPREGLGRELSSRRTGS